MRLSSADYLAYPIPEASQYGDSTLELRHNKAWDAVAITASEAWGESLGGTELFLSPTGLRVLIAAAQVMLDRLEAGE